MKRIVFITLIALAIPVAGLSMVALIGANIGKEQAIAQAEQPKSKYEVGPPDAQELLELVNAERARVGVAPLAIDDNVQKSAQLKADDMNNGNYFGHIMPSTGKVLNDEMKALLVSTCADSSENITDNTVAIDNYSLMSFNSWKNSAPHYKAMIDPNYTLTGFGISGTKVVQHFCIAK